MILEKSTNANELELENIEETVAEIPAESEKEESEQEIDEQPETELSEPLRRSQRVKRPPIRYGIDEFTNTANVTHVTYLAVKIEEPKTIDDALNGEEWKMATDLEYSSLMENQTWSLVKLPEGRNVVGCK